MTLCVGRTAANDAAFWDERLETQSRADWDRLKLELLRTHLEHAYAGSPYYRASFDSAGVHPDHVKDLYDLRRFPFITKRSLRERQTAVPPFGDLLAVPERDIVYISASSGSTGVPTASPFTARDFDEWIDYEARQFCSSHADGGAAAFTGLRAFENLRREVDRLFDDFDGGFWRAPFRRIEASFGAAPAVDVTQTDKAYEIMAELPGMDEKNIEVKLSNNILTIKGEKRDEKEETKKDYYMRERSFGAFERTFTVPDGVDADKVEASFKKGVLTVTLPKTAEAQKAEKKITVKAA